ncbi:MAG: hypothetical protein QM784_06110 [Polyangiaceae bacterium]
MLETLISRPVAGTASALMNLMKKDSAIETRHQVARAIGKAGLSDDVTAKLFEMMNDEVLVSDAALALILGGTPEVAARAVAMYGKIYGDKAKAPLEDLQELWYRTFGYWSKEDLEKGRIFKWVDNAIAISHVGDQPDSTRVGDGAADEAVRQPRLRQRPALLHARGASASTLADGSYGRRQARSRNAHVEVHAGARRIARTSRGRRPSRQARA